MASAAINQLTNASLGAGGSFGKTQTSGSSAQLRPVAGPPGPPAGYKAPTGNVLGIKAPTPTTKTPTGSGSNGSNLSGSQLQTAGVQSGNNTPNLPNLDSLYQPIFDSYNSTIGQIHGYQDQDTQDLTNSYNQNKGLIPGYQQSAQQTIDSNQLQLQNQTQSAYDQAARNYQWANAGNLNELGYNGAFLGANSMAQQEMQREIGTVGQQAIQGQQDIGKQNTDLSNWVNTQNATLDQQFSAAKDQLNQYFQNQLLAIQNDMTATQEQKAAGKISLLQDVMNQNNQIALQAQNFKQQLALYNAQLGATGGQNFDLSSFLNQMGGLGGAMQNQVNPANQAFQVATGSNNAPTWAAPSAQQNNDFLSQLLGGTGVQTNIPAGK